MWSNIDLAGRIKNAYITHNHPMEVTEYSFSSDDLNMFIEEKLSILRGVDEKYIYESSKNNVMIDSDFGLELSEESNRHLKNIRLAKELKLGYRRWKNE